jgi:hypothetical protein
MFNYFTNRIEAFDVEMGNSSSELVDYFLKRTQRAGRREVAGKVRELNWPGRGRFRRSASRAGIRRQDNEAAFMQK